MDPEGGPRHFYSCHPRMADDIEQRGIDLLSPVWHVLDLAPRGRGDWFAGLGYPTVRPPRGRVAIAEA
jgi:predicted dithiol-disulfide oxidoreductase (DUF899 family)